MFFIESSRAQTNESSVTNSAAPSASSVTTGGTNINYQTNNAYNNEMGFGGGVFWTPTLYFGGNAGKSDLDSFDGVTNSGNVTDNFSVNAGVLFPFGSSVHKDCKQLASTITLDRMISSELSMLKACNELYQKNIPVDSELFPLLKRCTNYKPKNTEKAIAVQKVEEIVQEQKNKVTNEKEKSKLIPKSFRAL